MSAIELSNKRPGKAAIMRASIEVMGQFGYEGASMRDMAARAGVSVAALYYHFPSKLDLLQQFLDEAYDVTLARLRRRLSAADPSPGAQLDELVGTLIASHLHDDFARQASKVALREYTHLDLPERNAIGRKRRRLRRMLTDILVAGVDHGEFHVSQPDEAARAILGLITSAIEQFEEMRRSMDDVIVLYQRFARGIATSG